MTITLSDITSATAAYIDNEIEVRIARVTGNVRKDNDGSYTVRVTNASAPTGVRLRDVVLHLWSTDSSVVTLYPPGSALLFPRATNDADAPRLPSAEPVGAMFIFFADDDANVEPNSTLDVGERIELELEYHGEGVGEAKIMADVHATVEVDDLFPRRGGRDVEAEVEIKS